VSERNGTEVVGVVAHARDQITRALAAEVLEAETLQVP
jgi:hypothetical protein